MALLKNLFQAAKNAAANNVQNIYGSGAPTNGTTGAGVSGPGSMYIDYTNSIVYLNTGTLASPTWVNIAGSGTLLRATGTISAADITGTNAGQLGHANGYIMVAAPGTNKALQLSAAAIYYARSTATYGAGGNLTVNWGAGGAALTGLVSAANSLGAAASKAIEFWPLSTAGVAIVSNAALNLVSSGAFTNPGTAAGVVTYDVWYRIVNVGF